MAIVYFPSLEQADVIEVAFSKPLIPATDLK
jgi:hypothetical protein